jgi:hypothetical protein
MQTHPDRGPFEVAIARTTGDERARRIFLEMARWPDDIRGGMYDHPTWHYAFKPVSDAAHAPQEAQSGEANEAFALNLAEARDGNAPPTDRAVALCWIFHVVGDIHQPLHTAQLFTARFPNGDHGGGLQFVRDPKTNEPESLHWFWDDAVNQSDEPDAVKARAAELEHAYPRSVLLPRASGEDWPRQFAHWALDESYPLAATLAYRQDIRTGDSLQTAMTLPPDYVTAATSAAERRVTLAGYRLADILRSIFAAKNASAR